MMPWPAAPSTKDKTDLAPAPSPELKARNPNLQVMEAVMISTSHISYPTALFLGEEEQQPDMPSINGGWLIWVGEEEFNESCWPVDLLACMIWAQEQGFMWLRLDMDSDPVDDLPTYEW